MKAWRTVLGTGMCSLLVFGCTISDDVDLDDDDDLPVMTDMDSGDEPDTDDNKADSSTGETDDSKADSGMSMMPDSGPAPEPIMCDPGADDSCEACLQNFCCQERQDCSVNDTCEEHWTRFRTCVVDADLNGNLPEDVVAVLDACEVEAGGEDDFDLDAKALRGCHEAYLMDSGEPLEPPAMDTINPMDSVCGQACYNYFDLQQTSF